MPRILSASAQVRVKNLLWELNRVRKMDGVSLKSSILKAADDKTAPDDPFMLSQVGTIVKRIRAKTDPAGSAELGLAEKKAGLLALGRRVATSAGAMFKRKPPVTVAPVVKPPAPFKSTRGGAAPVDSNLLSGAMGNKFTAERAMTLLKAALLRISA